MNFAIIFNHYLYRLYFGAVLFAQEQIAPVSGTLRQIFDDVKLMWKTEKKKRCFDIYISEVHSTVSSSLLNTLQCPL